MKIYTRVEKNEARTKLPKPILDFMGSTALTTLYIGIQKKLKLDLRQLMMYSEITNCTLMGLEPEHSLETNIHQWLPELGNAETKELAADINDRIFKEAKRRVEQNILESTPKDEDAEVIDLTTPIISDLELDKLAAQQEKEGWKPPVDPNEGPEGDIPEDTTPEELDESGSELPQVTIPEQKLTIPSISGNAVAAASTKPAPTISELPVTRPEEITPPRVSVPQVAQAPTPPPTQTPPIAPAPTFSTIAEEKLKVQTQVKEETVALEQEKAGIQQVGVPAKQAATQPAAPKTYKGTDPYREAIE